MNNRYDRENIIALIKLKHIVESISANYVDQRGEVTAGAMMYLDDIAKMLDQQTKPADILISLDLMTKVRNAVNKGDPELAAEIRWKASSKYVIAEDEVQSLMARMNEQAAAVMQPPKAVNETIQPNNAVAEEPQALSYIDKAKMLRERNRPFERINKEEWGSDELCNQVTDLIGKLHQEYKEKDGMYLTLLNSIQEPYDRIHMIHSYALMNANSPTYGDNPFHAAVLAAFPAVLAQHAKTHAAVPETPSPSAPPLPGSKSPSAPPMHLQTVSLFKNQDALLLDKLRAECKKVMQSKQSTRDDYFNLLENIEKSSLTKQKKVDLFSVVQKSLITIDPSDKTGLSAKVAEHIRANISGATKKI